MDTAEATLNQPTVPPITTTRFSPSEVIPSGSQYSDEQRRQAVALYIRHGVMSVVARHIDIPERTLNHWKTTEWWDDVAAEICQGIEDELRAGLRNVSLEGTRQALKQLESGEMKGKDAMITASIAYDKLRLSENRPTRITGSSQVEDLAAQLAKLSSQVNAKVVSEQ